MDIDKEQFLQIIDNAPLVSIDLILENDRGQVLLGKRVNRPAQDYWFVPGGRIRKNETISDAIKRISSRELDTELTLSEAQLLGTYNHIYKDNFWGKEGINTHYVVLAYKVHISVSLEFLHDDQHTEIKWWSKNDLLNSNEVHDNTKAYFKI